MSSTARVLCRSKALDHEFDLLWPIAGGRMKMWPNQVLIVDMDQDTLITLEKVFEDAGFDAITTWTAAEAMQLLASKGFDIFLVGDHPPEIDAVAILGELRAQGFRGACFILEPTIRKSDLERFSSLGAISLVSKWDHASLLEQVLEHSRTIELYGRSCKAG